MGYIPLTGWPAAKGERGASAEVHPSYRSAAPLLLDINGEGEANLIATDGAQNLILFRNRSRQL